MEFTGGSAAGYDLDITGWRGSIAMYVEANGVAEETSLEIGFLELFTLPLNASTAESLMAYQQTQQRIWSCCLRATYLTRSTNGSTIRSCRGW